MLFDVTWQIIAAAFILDVLAGDPGCLPHPIIWMGRAISFLSLNFENGLKIHSGQDFSLPFA